MIEDGIQSDDESTFKARHVTNDDATEAADTRMVTDGATTTNHLDTTLRLLAHPYRRRVLARLHDDLPPDREEFHIADLRTADEDPRQFSIQLYHVHLPKLADARFVDWDEQTQRIRRGPAYDTVADIVHCLHDRDDVPLENWL